MVCGAASSAIDTFKSFDGLAATVAVLEVMATVRFPTSGNRSLWMATKVIAIRTEQAIRQRAQRRERLAGEKMRRSESMA